MTPNVSISHQDSVTAAFLEWAWVPSWAFQCRPSSVVALLQQLLSSAADGGGAVMRPGL
jgi:hypothetical protein